MSHNRLKGETSPYLLQHRDNPVHWWPWGEEALAQATKDDKPILLSVGYAACHWCHVMAHESFEDQATADLMNAHFINIKVDREERPDVDRIYMDSLHALGEQGGWPLTMFLTPDAEPFWGGTYFPPEARYGRPSFKHVLSEIARVWREERQKTATNSQAILAALYTKRQAGDAQGLSEDLRLRTTAALTNAVDKVHGGLKGAPKFPQGPLFKFLWTMANRSNNPQMAAAVETTLVNICQGGIYDHLGGGMARYSVDERWLVPHFEKMLYDNAQFVSLASRVWLKTHSNLFRQRIEETIDFVRREMMVADGVFAASYDADSEGEEGKYYVWSKEEIDSVLGPDSGFFCQAYDVSEEGNWEGTNILNRLVPIIQIDEAGEARLAQLRAKLFERRQTRVPPGFDDKVLADWNGLMITALAEATIIFKRADWLELAETAFDRILELLWTGQSLHHSWRAGQAKHHATAEGYANLISAGLALYAASAKPSYLDWATKLADALVEYHWDHERGGLFLPSREATELIFRPRHAHDDATPNANGVMLGNFVKLHFLTGRPDYLARAEVIRNAFASEIAASPFGFPSLLENSILLEDAVQLILTGEQHIGTTHPLISPAIDSIGIDGVIGYAHSAEQLPETHPAHAKASRPGTWLYICRGPVCAAPAQTPDEVREALKMLRLVV